MSELTDLEICKKIAEIEGFEFWEHPNGDFYLDTDSHEDMRLFNPLINKDLCFDLMVKHKVKLAFGCEPLFTANAHNSTVWIDATECPQRAICLAIIAKHEANK